MAISLLLPNNLSKIKAFDPRGKWKELTKHEIIFM